MSKNWFGIEGHPTDEYIHWSLSVKQCIKESVKLRKDWDSIPEEHLSALKGLLSAAYTHGSDEASYDDSE